jgi:hypothetical protein
MFPFHMSLSPYRISDAHSPVFTVGVSGFSLRIVDIESGKDIVAPGQVSLSILRLYPANYHFLALHITGLLKKCSSPSK